MNRYQAWIKHEIRSIKWMGAYFLVLFIGYSMVIARHIQANKVWFLEDMDIYQVDNIMGRVLNAKYNVLMLLAAVLGLMILVYIQFTDSKNIEVGRFIKGLPLSTTKVYGLRIICGILSYTLPFIVLVVSVVGIRLKHSEWLGDLYRMTLWQEQFTQVESVGSILLILGMYYLIMTAFYVVLVMMQYLVMNSVFALILGVMVTFVPMYLKMAVQAYLRRGYMSSVWIPLMYGQLEGREHYSFAGELNRQYLTISMIENIGSKLIILLLIIGTGLGVGYIATKTFKVENQSKLMPLAVVRIIFVTVGTLCMSGLAGIVWSRILRFEMETIIALVMAIVSGGIGFVVCLVISRIGDKFKRRCSR
ncbi:MAG: hypothetical protein ACRCTE_13995 [Cellulosilyticaceae bacterium]